MGRNAFVLKQNIFPLTDGGSISLYSIMLEKSTARTQLPIRFPRDVKAWIEKQAHLNGSSQNSEVIRALRERMERQEGTNK